MFKTTSELQDFILWCQRAKIKSIKVDTVEVEFSDLAFLESISEEQASLAQQQTRVEEKLSEIADKTEEEELLFWSTKG
jgi:hypothetical protein